MDEETRTESAYLTSCSSKQNGHETQGHDGSYQQKKMRSEPEIDEAVSPSEFPEEMVEAIIAKMPFPSLSKARALSSRWYLKFTDFSCETSAFQSQVSANSASWGTYAPVLMNWTDMSLLAFHDGSKSQVFSTLPPYLDLCHDRWSQVWLAGTLVLLIGPEPDPTTFSVANVVSGSWAHLTLPPHLGSRRYGGQHLGPISLIAVGNYSYKVLSVFHVIHSEGDGFPTRALCIHLYDSNSQSWTSNLNKFSDDQALSGLQHFFDQNCAYMDGKVYFLARYGKGRLGRLKLVSYDLENTAWTIVFSTKDLARIAIEGFAYVLHDESGVFRCKDKIIVVIMSKFAISASHDWTIEEEGVGQGFCTLSITEKSVQIFELDMRSLKLFLISDGPPETRVLLKKPESGPNARLSADASFVYLCWDCFPTSMLKFDVNSRKWSLIPIASSTPDFDSTRHDLGWVHGVFEPGLNPFVTAWW